MTRRLALVALVGLALVAPPASAALGPTDPGGTHRVVVNLDPLTLGELQDGVDAADGQVLRIEDDLGFAVLELGEPDAFADETGVAATPDRRGSLAAATPLAEAPEDPYYGGQWGPTELNAPQAWRIVGPSLDPTVAVVDSGIAADHPDLAGIPVTMGHDYVEDDEDPQDEAGHGTHVAGIVSADRGNRRGVAGMVETELYVARVFDEDGSGWCSDMASAIEEAVDAGADVVNLSGHCGSHYGPLHDAVTYAESHGVLVVASAGNAQDSNPDACVLHPAVHGEVVAVGATDPTLTPARYSCRGQAVELAAPGTAVLSTVPDDDYALYSGTSMSAPHVTATVAMLLHQDPTLGTDEVRERLRETARDLGEPGHDPAYGHGMVDPVAALTGLPAWEGDLTPASQGPASP